MIKVEWRGQADLHRAPHDEMLGTLDKDVAHAARSRIPKDSDAARLRQERAPQRSRPSSSCWRASARTWAARRCRASRSAPADLGADWPGGFYCPCHGSKFDLAGRVFAGVPAPPNLTVPPYRFINDSTILIGADTGNS